MNIQHLTEGKQGKFFIEENGQQLALMEYHRGAEDKIIIDHTEVDPSLKGQGVGKKLVEAAVAMARAEQVKILPVCPFAKATMERGGDAYADVIAR